MKRCDDMPIISGAAGRPAAPRPLMSEMRVAVVGALMVTIGPMSLTLYTPAMPTLVAAFNTDITTVKLTLTVFFMGFALSQLACGPLSDAFGRRPVALSFFGLYLAGSIVAMTAADVHWLLAGRALQGVGCAAGISISRAIVRDQYTGQASARIMNLIGTMLAVGPAVAPTIGGFLLGLASWQIVFVAMSVVGVMIVCLITFAVPETNRAPDRALASPANFLRSYKRLLADRTFLKPGLMLGFALGGIYTLASLIPFILINEVGLTPTKFGLSMAIQSGSFICGSLVAGLLLKRMNALQLIPIGLTLVLCGAASFALGLRLLPLSVITVMAPVSMWAFGLAFVVPGCTTSALAGFAHIAGAASALLGFMQIGGGFFGSALSVLFPTPVVALSTILPAMAVCATLVHVLLRVPRSAEEIFAEAQVDLTDVELATDPLAVIGAAGDEIEVETFDKAS